MCKYASFVLTKDRVFWLPKDESHEAIIKEFNLCESDTTHTRINILRVEISPVKIFSDLSKWEYKVDQDLRPDWFDEKECERRTRKELKNKVDKKLLAAFVDLDKFLASIPKVKYFQQHKPIKPEWKIYYSKDRAAAGDVARAAAWDAARAAAGDAARAAAGDAAWDAARAAAGDVARAADWDAVGAAAGDAAWDAAWDAALQARIIICKGLKLDKKHIDHAKARWDVWKRGYGLYCDVNGTLYVYGVKK
jgi:hypothetical protein